MEFLSEILLRNAEEYPDRTAVIQDERTLNYREMNREVNRLANALKKHGLKKGNRAALLMRGSADWLLFLYACQKIGVALVLIHLRQLPEEILRMMTLADANILIYDTEYSDKADYIAGHYTGELTFVCVGGSPERAGVLSFGQLMCEEDVTEAYTPLTDPEPSIILFTSGTTSASKGIVRTQEMMAHYCALLRDDESRARGDVMLTPSPLYHAAGLCCVVKMLENAGALVLLNRFDSEKICREIQRCRATQVALVPPTSYRRLSSSGYPKRYDLSSVRLVHLAAGKASEECLREVFEMFPNAGVRISWGSTEASNITELMLSRDEVNKNRALLCSVGRENPVSELKLVAEDGSTVEGAGKGEAYVRSPLVFHGYLKAPELTARCFSGGWFKTEDIIYRDENGYCYLLDRKRDIIKTGGENVYAQEVEQDILKNSAISECAVVGIPDRKYGEAIAAAVVFQPGCSLSAAEFVSFCRRVMPSFKKPKYWAVMPELPKNDVGKIQKNILKEKAGMLFTPIV